MMDSLLINNDQGLDGFNPVKAFKAAAAGIFGGGQKALDTLVGKNPTYEDLQQAYGDVMAASSIAKKVIVASLATAITFGVAGAVSAGTITTAQGAQLTALGTPLIAAGQNWAGKRVLLDVNGDLFNENGQKLSGFQEYLQDPWKVGATVIGTLSLGTLLYYLISNK